MHTFIQYIHKHLVVASFATLVLASMAWIADGYANPNATNAASMVDVSLSVTPYPTVVANEELAGFLLYYKTRGGGTSEGIQVSATLPAGVTLLSSFPATYTQQGSTYTWTNLPNNYGPVVLEVRVEGTEGSTKTIQAEVSTISNDADSSNDQAQGTVTILNTQASASNSDMQVSLSTAQDTVVAGTTVPYTIQYKNNGPDLAGESIIVMTLPNELTYVTGNTALDPLSTSNTLVWKVYDLDSGDQGQISLNLLVSNIVDAGDAVFTYVTISSPNTDATPSNNQSHKSVVVGGTQAQPTSPTSPASPGAGAGAGAGAGDAAATVPETPTEQSTVGDDEKQTDQELPLSSGFLFTVREDESMTVPSTNTCASAAELQSAYSFAYSNDITTMATLAQARMCDGVIRAELAKMISNYAINVLDKTPDTSIACAFNDMSEQPQDLQQAAITACQLGLMGLDADGKPAASFNPKQTVTRAIFGTAFSRLLYGDTYNIGGSTWYEAHLDALSDDGIIKNVTPSLQELRGYIMIMMQRSQK